LARLISLAGSGDVAHILGQTLATDGLPGGIRGGHRKFLSTSGGKS